jgi:hypothetical protein
MVLLKKAACALAEPICRQVKLVVATGSGRLRPQSQTSEIQVSLRRALNALATPIKMCVWGKRAPYLSVSYAVIAKRLFSRICKLAQSLIRDRYDRGMPNPFAINKIDYSHVAIFWMWDEYSYCRVGSYRDRVSLCLETLIHSNTRNGSTVCCKPLVLNVRGLKNQRRVG